MCTTIKSPREYPLAHVPSHIRKSDQIEHTSDKGEHSTKRKEREQTDTSSELPPESSNIRFMDGQTAAFTEKIHCTEPTKMQIYKIKW